MLLVHCSVESSHCSPQGAVLLFLWDPRGFSDCKMDWSLPHAPTSWHPGPSFVLSCVAVTDTDVCHLGRVLINCYTWRREVNVPERY